MGSHGTTLGLDREADRAKVTPGVRIKGALAAAALMISSCAALAAAFSGFGTRWGWWYFATGFSILAIAACAAVGGIVLGLVGLLWPPRKLLAPANAFTLLALVIGAVTAGIPLLMLRTVESMPRIHDITTDTDHPPAFVANLALRKGFPNSADYAGAEVARQQHEGYPDLAPTQLAVPPPAAFDRALAAAKSLGWTITATVPGDGRIEATDTTFWYGFTDDIVVRVASDGTGSRVDVRSESRVGKGDVGTNARRIRRFLAALTNG
jgi:uncharacterized protein (DUF1499 family)